MDKDVVLDFEIFLTGNIDLELIKNEKEIILEQYEIYGTVNRIPFYRIKLKSDSGLVLGKILKIMEQDEAVSKKEQLMI